MAGTRKKRSASSRGQASAPPRRKALARRRRIGSIVQVVEALICFAVLGGIGYAFTQYLSDSERFKVSRLQIEGTELLEPASIRAVAGITDDDSLLLFEAEAARQRVEAMPYVKSCSIQRAYPDTVIIRVEERRPEAYLLVHHRTYEIDDEGVLLRELDPLAPYPGPLISEIPDIGFVELGERIENETLSNALALWAAFKNTDLAQEWTISEIAASKENTLLMYCDNVPFEVRWVGRDLRRQAKLLDIWWKARKDDIPCNEYLDLRFGFDALVCK